VSEIDFKGLAHALRHRARELVPEWLPGGKIVGKEYTCSDIHGGQGSSFKVNVDSGVWKDFSTDNMSGADLISLYAAVKGYSQIEAARALLSYVGTTVETSRQSKVKPSDERLGPPPPGVGKPIFTHHKFGEPEGVWIYRDSDGSVLFYMARYFNKEDNKKEFLPHSWSVSSKRWVKKQWPSPRPLYGLELLAKHPKTAVLVVEGEKSADAARKMIPPSTYVVVSWPSGAAASMLADWTPLHGRKILLWPDADLKEYPKDHNVGRENMGRIMPEHKQPGFIAMQKIAAQLVDHCPEVKVLKTFKCSETHGWDVADAIAEGMDWEKFKAWAKPRAEIFKKPVARDDGPPDYMLEGPPMNEEPQVGSSFDASVDGYYTEISTQKGPRWTPLYSLMAKDLLKEGDHVFDSKGHYRYMDGVWEAVSDDYLKNKIVTVNTLHIQPAHIDNFAKIIKSFCYLGATSFKDTDHRINIQNGVLDLHEYKIEPHSKDFFFKWKIPVSYEPKSGCPKWLEFLDSVFEGDKTLTDAAQRIFGYILMGGRPFLHKAFVLYGEGRNGKSVFLNTLMKIIGESNFSTVSLSNLDKPFSAVMLDGKIANILEETPTDKINPEIFKAAVGGGYVQMSRKHMDEYSAKVSARFIFACNKLPIFGDNTTGNLDRLFFLPFNRYYAESERDGDLEIKLEEELPGILNWAIEGIKIVRTEKRIEEPVPALKLKEQYQQESDSVYSWMQDRLEFSDSYAGEHTDTLYKDYRQMSESSALRPVSKINFARTLSKHGRRAAQNVGAKFFIQERIYVGGTQARGFLSCRLIQTTNYASLLGKNKTDETGTRRIF
jgi:putative DNA primase/helicase